MSKVFASAILAHRTTPEGKPETIWTVAIIRTAQSNAEACMVALGIALDRWPAKDGWERHGENTQEVEESISPIGNI